MITNKQKKFTLIEILAAVAILAILAGITTGIIGYVRAKTNEARTIATIEIIKVALEQYKEKYGYYLPISKGNYVKFRTDAVTNVANATKDNFNQFVDYNSFIKQGTAVGNAYEIHDGYGKDSYIWYCYPGKVNKGSYDLGSLGADKKSGDGGASTPDEDNFGAGDDITNCKQ
jgi:prepilin-type N-terminal cleavage/methylation domain-containing protein